jgi:hypothetical protein
MLGKKFKSILFKNDRWSQIAFKQSAEWSKEFKIWLKKSGTGWDV